MKTFQDIYRQIKDYTPYNEREAMDQKVILSLMRVYSDIFDRSNLVAHMSATAWVTNKNRDKVLMAHHNLFHSFAWLGGHADGNMDLLQVAISEAMEESSISGVKPVREEIFSIEVLNANGHVKNGIYVPTHLHCNVSYLLEADDALEVKAKPDENSAVCWFGVDEVLSKVTEPWMVENVYPSLLERMKLW